MDRRRQTQHGRRYLIAFGLVLSMLALGWTQTGSSISEALAKDGKGSSRQGEATAGRSVFNGKGVCYYCHGMDGYRDKLPQLDAQTAVLIAQLNPQPADLRNPNALRLTTDKARAKAIREGHEGTGMFPDTRMTDQELADTLAYLAELRGQQPTKQP
jgi:cytochrome c553